MSPYEIELLDEEIALRRQRILKLRKHRDTSYVRNAREFNAKQLRSLREERLLLKEIFE